jgi:hypothetical protein
VAPCLTLQAKEQQTQPDFGVQCCVAALDYSAFDSEEVVQLDILWREVDWFEST